MVTRMGRLKVQAVLVALVLAVAGAGAAAAATAEGALSSDQLVYAGAQVGMQVDVNGEAAMQLLGGALDAALEVATQQADAMVKAGAPPQLAMAKMAAPLAGQLKDAIKSVSRVAAVVMKPGAGAKGEDIRSYYLGMMTKRGWTSVVTVQGGSEGNVAVLMAPGAKGLFAMVQEKEELIVAMITTTAPLGDLLEQVIRAGGGLAAQAMMMKGAGFGGPPAPAAPAPAEPEEAED